MTIAYFDCFSGISGDMTLGALIDAGADVAILDATKEALRLTNEVKIEVRHEERGHLGGTRVIVETEESGHPRNIKALMHVINESEIPNPVKKQAVAAVQLIGRAEQRIHNVAEEDVHLHELGGADTLMDLVGAFWLLHDLDVARVYASPLPAPRGATKEMPLPAPASMRVLEGAGAIFQPSDQERELVTPTGAAILAVAATFERPTMSLATIGYGIGTKDVANNALAVWIGQLAETESGVTVIDTNVDDMAPNLIAGLTEDLMSAGALDVSVTPTVMKKGRPGHLITVIAPPDRVAFLTDHLLRHSTTLGVRLTDARRVLAHRRIVEVQTPLGTARVKVKEIGGKAVDATPEYEDCRRISIETGLDLRDVMRLVADAGRRELGLT